MSVGGRTFPASLLFLAALAAAAEDPRPATLPPPDSPETVPAQSAGASRRIASASGRSPLSITSATAQTFYCTQPDPRQDACYINVAYTSGTYTDAFGALHLSIDGKIVFRAQGFFQQTASTDNFFAGLGFRVPCGPPVDDPGDPGVPKRQVGNAYTVDLKWNGASGAWDLDDQLSVRCPPYDSTQGAPVIAVAPASLASTQTPGTTSTRTLTVSDLASFPLWWNLLPSPATGCGAGSVPWLSVSTPAGTTQPLMSEPVIVTFDSTRLAQGNYAAHVCVQSGDTFSPAIDVPVALTVACPPGPLMISAPSTVGAGSPGRLASVRPNAGSTFTWSIANGTITGGQGTNAVTFTAGVAGPPLFLFVTETNPGPYACVATPGSISIPVLPAGSSLAFYAVPPCRLADTRLANGPLGGPALAPSEVRTLAASGSCLVPAGALGISMNVTVTQAASNGFVAVYPGNASYPGTSSLSFRAGQTRANNAIIGLASDGTGTFRVFNNSAGSVQVIVDVNGYFY